MTGSIIAAAFALYLMWFLGKITVWLILCALADAQDRKISPKLVAPKPAKRESLYEAHKRQVKFDQETERMGALHRARLAREAAKDEAK